MGGRSKADESNEAVYNRILSVVHSGQAAPGQRMPEPAIARALGVSRERVRRALHRLAHEGWLELVPNKGACIPDVSEYNLLQAFEARRLLESAIVKMIAERPNTLAMEEIEEHLREEHKAQEQGDRARQIALSGLFHEKLFDLAGNQWLSGFFRQIMAPTVSAYAIYAPRQLPNCGGPHEHQAIVEALRRRDGETAASIMDAHLQEGAAYISRFRAPKEEPSIEVLFSGLGPIDEQDLDGEGVSERGAIDHG